MVRGGESIKPESPENDPPLPNQSLMGRPKGVSEVSYAIVGDAENCRTVSGFASAPQLTHVASVLMAASYAALQYRIFRSSRSSRSANARSDNW
jgi:hypothetical protein